MTRITYLRFSRAASTNRGSAVEVFNFAGPDCEEDFGKIIVHGHSPVREPDIRPNRINIDTGAYATGRLTCQIIEGDEMRFP